MLESWSVDDKMLSRLDVCRAVIDLVIPEVSSCEVGKCGIVEPLNSVE
jgi:hypothetical protein